MLSKFRFWGKLLKEPIIPKEKEKPPTAAKPSNSTHVQHEYIPLASNHVPIGHAPPVRSGPHYQTVSRAPQQMHRRQINKGEIPSYTTVKSK